MKTAYFEDAYLSNVHSEYADWLTCNVTVISTALGHDGINWGLIVTYTERE